ncbi:MAG: PAS domain S-box protein, partial [Anaerolineae bacterium]|nr:PAS domain S-box protein [Anaerolineae bacterium]
MPRDGTTMSAHKHSAERWLTTSLWLIVITTTAVDAILYNVFSKPGTLIPFFIILLINNLIITGITAFFTYRALNGKSKTDTKTHQEIGVQEAAALYVYQKQLETQNEELRKLTQAVEQSANTIVITDLQGRIEYANPKFTETTGYTVAEALGQNPRILKSDKQPKEYYKSLWETITAGEEWHGEFYN